MIYLIEHLSLWLLLTAAFAGLAGWAFAALRAHPAESSALRERDRLMRDLLTFSADGASGGSPERERELSTLRHRADLGAARITELEHALEAARSRAEDAAARIAELQRAGGQNSGDNAELIDVRARLAAMEAERDRAIVVETTPEPFVQDDEHALQAWRLRYFEQRVRYLENHAPAAAPAPGQPAPANPDLEWRARTAEARVAYLEEEARKAEATPPPAPAHAEEVDLASPFAANAETDMLMRWRMLYLERRTAHLQAHQPPATEMDTEEAERWKWRARYLEARVRHLESRPAPAPVIAPLAFKLVEAEAPAAQDVAEQPAPPPLVPAGAEERPRPLGAARDGAPDDFTLIEGVSPLQQRTLNSLGVYHFDQIAAWTPANVAWVDQYLRLRGRIVEEEWVEQAGALAREGPNAARRIAESEEA